MPRLRAMRILLLVSCLLLGIPSLTKIISNPDVDEKLSLNDPGSDPDDDTAVTQTAGDKQFSNSLAKRRMSERPVSRILENLFSRTITVPTGLSHQDLFTFFLASSNSDLTPPNTSNPAPAKAES